MTEADTTIIYGHGASPIPETDGWRNSSARWGINDFREFLAEAGYDSLQWTPLRPSRLWQQIQFQRRWHVFHNMNEEGWPLVHSLHQTWRQDTIGSVVGDILCHPLEQRPGQLSRKLGAIALMERNKTSLLQLIAMQSVISPARRLPVVLYPTIDNGDATYHDLPFNERWFQLTAEVWNTWHIQDTDHLNAEMQDHGFTGVVLDLALLRQRFPENSYCQQLPPWQELIPSLGRHIKCVQIGLDRYDMARTDPAAARISCQEGEIFRSSAPDEAAMTEQAAMLRLALATARAAGLDHFNPLPLVVETPRHPSQDGHIMIVQNIRQIIDQAK